MRMFLLNQIKELFLKSLNVSKDGVYTIPMGELNPAYKYRLSINWNNKEYKSEYLNPLDTPVIDSISVESSAIRNSCIYLRNYT